MKTAISCAAGVWIALMVMILYAYFDQAPVLTRNITTTDKAVYTPGDRVILKRDVIKERDCAVSSIVHRLMSDEAGFLPPLYVSRIKLVGAGKSEFRIAFRVPETLEDGFYRHRVSIKYQCNPFFENGPYVAESNLFEVSR